MTASGDGPASSQSGQVGFTDLSDSGSDIDIDAFVDHSDQNLSSDSQVFDRVHNTGKGHHNHNPTDKNHISTQILAQLNVLGARLDNMESSMKMVKKTNDSTKIKRSKVKTKGGVAHVGLKGVGTASCLLIGISVGFIYISLSINTDSIFQYKY